MAEGDTRAFGALLKQHRTHAGLTQEKLAERAEMSARGVMHLEHGDRRPYPDTLLRLIEALALPPAQRDVFTAAARRIGRVTPGDLPSASRIALPTPLTPLIGRTREVAEADALLREPGVRLVTLTGPGGTGKTRLALAVAAALADAFTDGIAFVSLAALTDPELILPAIAAARGVTSGTGESLMESVCAALRDRRLLIVLDNFEQVVAAAPDVADLLAACPGLKALVTSRAALRLRGEHEVAIPPLSLPDPHRLPDLAALGAYEAIRLFVARAKEIRPDFALTEENARAVAEICARLDGLPLAIELAAARTRLLPPAALLARLAQSLTVLTGGARDLPTRQQTLRDTITWSYDLLTPAEQRLARRLAVFAGGWTLEAAGAVCYAEDERARDVLDDMESLVAQSLVRHGEGTDGEPRFGMLETIRAFAGEILTAQGEADATARRHAMYYLALAEEAEPYLAGGPHQAEWLRRMDAEHDNLRAALAWCARHDEWAGLRLAGALGWFWFVRGHLREGRQWLERALAADGASEAAARAKALVHLGVLAIHDFDYPAARPALEESLALSRQIGDERGIAFALFRLGLVARQEGNDRGARCLWEESLRISSGHGKEWGIVRFIVLTQLGDLLLTTGECAQAIALYEEGLALGRDLEDAVAIASSLGGLAAAALQTGEYERAETLHEESLAHFRAVGHQDGIGLQLTNLGWIALRRGADERARALLAEALIHVRGRGGRRMIAVCLVGMGAIAGRRGEAVRAARLFGAAERRLEASGESLLAPRRAIYEECAARVRALLGAAAWTEAHAVGRALSEEQAVADALEECAPV